MSWLQEYADCMAVAERIAGFGVWRWDVETGVVRWSDQLHRIYGLEPGSFEGTAEAFTARLHPDDRERVWGHVRHAVETLEPFAFEERILRPDGVVRVLLSEGRVLAGEDGRAAAVLGVCHDVTDRRSAQSALGISERRMRAILDNSPSFIAVKDLDGRYLMANAAAGRIVGMPPDQLVGRVCADMFPPELSGRLRENDRRAAAEGAPVYDEVVLVRDGEPRTFDTVTFALPDEHGLPVETCTIATDVTERREREGERRERLHWRRRVGGALEDERLVVHAQPVVDLRTGEAVSCELLVRLREKQGLVTPGQFLPQAERFGLVQFVDVWMVDQALRAALDGERCVNLSAVTLCDPAAREQILDALAHDRAAAAQLVFEITETAALEHLDAARSFAEEATRLGCGLALDDFGTGFGSFTYLRALPLRYLKIDMGFVRNLVHDRDDRRVVQSIVGIAEQFGLETIAEGVEDAATLDLLRELGAHLAQGFHLGAPSPLSDQRPSRAAWPSAMVKRPS